MKKIVSFFILFFFVFIHVFVPFARADITEWTALTPGPDTGIKFNNASVRSIAYGNGVFVAGGQNGRASYSTDGINWTALPAGDDTGIKFGTGTTVSGIAYGNGRFIAVGQNKASYSTDGISWTVMTPPISVPYAITYGSDKFVVVGENGTGAYSSADGLSWTALTPGANTGIKTGSTAAYTVTYGNGKFVTAGWDGKASYSTDGISWTALTPGADTGIKFGTTPITGVYYGNDTFVAVGWSGKASYSTDGISWTALTPGADTGIKFDTTNLQEVAFGNGKFVAVGDSGKASYSTDGISWTALTPGADTGIKFGTTNLQAVAFGNGKFVAVGDSGKASYSTEFIPTPTPTPTITPTPTPTSQPVNNNSQSNNSAPASTSTCNDSKPNGTPDLFQINVTTSQATLFFTPINGISNYYISYSTNVSAEQFGVEAILSDEGVQTYTVNELSPGTTYYFKVRGQNGCMPGGWSNIKSAVTVSSASTTFINDFLPQQPKMEIVDIKTETSKPNQCSYSVKPGDNLWNIAQDVYGNGNSYLDIAEYNKEKYPMILDTLAVGWMLSFPCDLPVENPDNEAGQSGHVDSHDVVIKVMHNGKPLGGVNVELHSDPKYGVTDEKGEVLFAGVPKGEHTLKIAYESYDAEQKVNVDGDTKEFNISVNVELKDGGFSSQAYAVIAGLVAIILSLLFILFRKKLRREKK